MPKPPDTSAGASVPSSRGGGPASIRETSPPSGRRDGKLAGRFTFGRCLGSGSFGVVFEAREEGKSAPVALKRLNQADAGAIYDFKQEFRAVAHVIHPNLVTLHELFSAGGDLYLSMELVDGISFLEYVWRSPRNGAPDAPTEVQDEDVHPTVAVESLPGRNQESGVPSSGAGPASAVVRHLDLERLRASLRQLAEGVAAIHAAGKLHRDLKPSNVMVTHDGRVKILDFGLVAGLPLRSQRERVDRRVVGTPAYMSPEQAQGAHLTPASDWYALGVILYEALTGRLPLGGNANEILSRKVTLDPPDPRLLAPDLPDDLCDLCVGLLQRKAGDRPSGAALLATLGGEEPEQGDAPEPWSEELPFIGRDHHLDVLEGALADARRGRSVTVHVHGTSGMGKSALLRRFLDEAEARDHAVVLEGRCYERESVPYKAVDSLIDSLTQHLRGQPQAEVEALIPPDVQTLARLFPVLRRLDAVREAPRRAEAPDLQELRRRAFGSLREILTRMASQRPLVITIDDLQWGDADSAALLIDLLEPTEARPGADDAVPSRAPALLLIASYRSEDAHSIELVRVLRERLSRGELGCDVRELVVGPLANREARMLARVLLAGEAEGGTAEQIAHESGGSPLFVHELARHVRASAKGGAISRSAGRAEPRVALSLPEVLAERLARLPEGARRLLEAVAVAASPIAEEALCRAAGLDAGAPALSVLRAERLVRVRGSREHAELETFHDRYRQAAVAGLSPGDLAGWHRRIAEALLEEPEPDPEALFVHLLGGGEAERALGYVEIAADRAADALAFDRAAVLYRKAIELYSAPTRALRVKLAHALANAGRGAESARAFVVAAEGAPAAEALDLRRRSAEQLLRSGHIDEGLAAVEEVLAAVDLGFPKTPTRALASLVYRRAQLSLRGTGFTEKSLDAIPADDLTRIDVCWSVGHGLSGVDIVRGADFQARTLLEALRAGEPYRIARSLASEAIFTAQEGGSRGRSRAAELVARSADIARRIQHPHALAWATAAAAGAAHYDYRFRESLETGERAVAIFRENCRDITWEVASIQIWWVLGSLFYLGEIDDLVRRTPLYLREAQELGALYTEASMRTYAVPRVHLAMDRPDEARREAESALREWSRRGWHTQHLGELATRVLSHLYEGNGLRALDEVDEGWPSLDKSLLLRVELVRVEMHAIRGHVRVLAARQGHDARERLLADAERDAKTVDREGRPYTSALSALLRGGIALARGRIDRAIGFYREAELGFDRLGMGLYAASARRRQGEILGGEEGRGMVRESIEWMVGQRVRSPERMAEMLAPV